MNIALPYQDLTIMDACLACGVNYMDTANYEPEDTDDPQWRAIYEKRCKEEGFSAYFDYSWQWAYRKKFEDAGLTALLGCGFDPGVTQAYCAHALKHEFDQIDTIDILDCNCLLYTSFYKLVPLITTMRLMRRLVKRSIRVVKV